MATVYRRRPRHSLILLHTAAHHEGVSRQVSHQFWSPAAAVTDDPRLATGHLPDFTVVILIFHRGEIVGSAGCIAHFADVGGALWLQIAANCSKKEFGFF